MGTATFLVGCLPTYDDIGIWAPVLLVALRLLQGFSASGEQAGANSLSLEHAPDHRRAFFTSFTLSGTQAGLVIATAVFLPIGAMPEDQLLQLGLARPVLAERDRRRRRPDHPPPARGAAGVPARRPSDETRSVPLAELLRDHRRRRRCASRWPRWPRPSARSSPSTRCRSRSTPTASTRRRCCGSRSSPTSSRWPRSRCGRCSPTASAASPCSSSARSAAAR